VHARAIAAAVAAAGAGAAGVSGVGRLLPRIGTGGGASVRASKWRRRQQSVRRGRWGSGGRRIKGGGRACARRCHVSGDRGSAERRRRMRGCAERGGGTIRNTAAERGSGRWGAIRSRGHGSRRKRSERMSRSRSSLCSGTLLGRGVTVHTGLRLTRLHVLSKRMHTSTVTAEHMNDDGKADSIGSVLTWTPGQLQMVLCVCRAA
jgi:hypothetical protein